MEGKELQQRLIENMKNWQKVEHAAIVQTAKIMEKTEYPLIKLVMEVIQRDSQMHYRTQEFIVDSLQKASIAMSPDDLVEIWDLIEEHIKIEKKTIELAKQALNELSGKKMVIQQYLLEYLLADEEKHDKLLEKLEKIKSGMYPYSGY